MDFDLIEIPDEAMEVLGEPDPGTRIYRAVGPVEGFDEWWKVICEVCGPENAVSPGGVAMYVNASRTAVHKRLSKGQLTAFFFHIVERRKSWWRGVKTHVSDMPSYGFIPVIECKRWAEVLRRKRSERTAMKGEPERLFVPVNKKE